MKKSSHIGCNNKRKYVSREDAEEEIYLYIQESLGGCVDLRPYKCKYCNGWHITSRIK